jgi:hypothetical protein
MTQTQLGKPRAVFVMVGLWVGFPISYLAGSKAPWRFGLSYSDFFRISDLSELFLGRRDQLQQILLGVTVTRLAGGHYAFLGETQRSGSLLEH